MTRRHVIEPAVVDTDRARLPQKNPRSKHIDTGNSFKLTNGFSPVILTSGEVTLTAGGTAVPDHGKLQPIERTPMLIDEIHFNSRAAISGGPGLDEPAWDTRFMLRAQIRAGRNYLTNGYVPIGALEYEHLTNLLVGSRVLASTDYNPSAITGTRWKLPVPLYVPAGEALSTELYMSLASTFSLNRTTTLYADVSYIGRLLPVDYPIPKTIKIPYVTSIQSPDDVGANGPPYGGFLESKDLQLGNPFDTTLYAQRLIHRSFESRNYSLSVGTAFPQTYEGGSPLITLRGTFQNQDISIANRMNHYVVFDDGISLGIITSPGTTLGHHVLNLHNLQMEPKDRFDLTIDSRAATVFPPWELASLVGWRNAEI